MSMPRRWFGISLAIVAWFAAPVSAQPQPLIGLVDPNAPVARLMHAPSDPNAIPFDHPCKRWLRSPEAAAAAEAMQQRDLATRFYAMAFDETDVLHYELEIEPLFDIEELVGTNRMQIRAKIDGLTEFWFRLTDSLAVTDALINETTPVNVTRVSTSTCIATLDRTYNAGEEFALTIQYAGAPDTTFQFGTRFTPEHELFATTSSPFHAFAWWPCKDGDYGTAGDNRDRATVTVSIIAPNTHYSLAQGTLQRYEGLPNDRGRYTWSSKYAMPAYLNFVSSAPYETLVVDYDYGSGVMPVEFNHFLIGSTWGFSGVGQVISMLGVFESLYGPFPFRDEKYGVYDFHNSGGMEHPTSSGQNTLDQDLTAHEIAHQWWGDEITCQNWHHVWVKEGFATYSEQLFREFRDGDPNYLGTHARMLASNSFGGTPYREDTSSFASIFVRAPYERGAWVLHLLRQRLGDELFFRVLRTYRARFAGGATTTDDFAHTVQEATGQDLTAFFDNWVYNNGTPRYQYGGESVEIDGVWCVKLSVEQIQPTEQIYTMPIDVRVRLGGGNRPQFILPNDALLAHYVLPTVLNAHKQIQFDPLDLVPGDPPIESTYVQGPPVVLATSPVPGAIVEPNAPITTIEVTFSELVDVDPSNFAVEDLAGPPLAETPTVQWIPARQTAQLTFASPLPPGDYAVTVRDTIEFAGQALDGEIAGGTNPGGFPSGDGQPGGDAVFRFTVGMSPTCAADLNGDGRVDSTDLAMLLSAFGGTEIASRSGGDLNGDGAVDGLDLGQMLAAFGKSCE